MSTRDERDERKALQRAQTARERPGHKKIVVVGLATLVILGAIAIAIARRPPSNGATDNPAAISDNDHRKGAIVPKATLIEYGDFQCPACKSYYALVKQLLERFPTELAVVYRHYPLTRIHPNAIPSAMAAEAADRQGKFFQMHDLLYERQEEWAALANPQQKFEEYARQIGLDVEQWKKDKGNATLRTKVKNDEKSGNKLKVTGTPTFFLNGKKIENPRSLEEFERLIREAVAGAPSAPAETTASKPFHEHTNFLVMIEGKPLDFSKTELQSTHEKEIDKETHLHNERVGIAHIHQEGQTWQDFFQSLGMDLSATCFTATDKKEYCANGNKKLSIMLNGALLEEWSALPIHDLDRLLVSVGGTTPQKLQQQFKQVPDDACIFSEKCPQRGKPPEEEPCVGGLGTTCE